MTETTNASAKPGLSRTQLDDLARILTSQGMLIEAGFAGMRIACIPLDAPPIQLHEMRLAFFAGAQHLFGSIMSILDPGAEPTDADMERMDKIDAELKAFIPVLCSIRHHGATTYSLKIRDAPTQIREVWSVGP